MVVSTVLTSHSTTSLHGTGRAWLSSDGVLRMAARRPLVSRVPGLHLGLLYVAMPVWYPQPGQTRIMS